MQIEIFTAPDCGYCDSAKTLLKERGLSFVERSIAEAATLAEFRERLPRVRSIPQLFVGGEHIGGYEDLRLRLDRRSPPFG